MKLKIMGNLSDGQIKRLTECANVLVKWLKLNNNTIVSIAEYGKGERIFIYGQKETLQIYAQNSTVDGAFLVIEAR